jgi:hypothetical protein
MFNFSFSKKEEKKIEDSMVDNIKAINSEAERLINEARINEAVEVLVLQYKIKPGINAGGLYGISIHDSKRLNLLNALVEERMTQLALIEVANKESKE